MKCWAIVDRGQDGPLKLKGVGLSVKDAMVAAKMSLNYWPLMGAYQCNMIRKDHHQVICGTSGDCDVSGLRAFALAVWRLRKDG